MLDIQTKPVEDISAIPMEPINLYGNLLEFDEELKSSPEARKNLVSLKMFHFHSSNVFQNCLPNAISKNGL